MISDIDNSRLDAYKKYLTQYRECVSDLDTLEGARSKLVNGEYNGIVHILIIIIIFSVLIFYDAGLIASIFLSLIISWYFYLFLSVLIDALPFGKLKSIKKEIENLERMKSDLKEKLKPFEYDLVKESESQLDVFYSNHLYNQRSGNRLFEESLSEFEDMISAGRVLNNVLITKKISLKDKEEYLRKRRVDHTYLSNKKSVELVNIQNFVNSLQKTTHKNKVIPLSPEKLYRSARKIDNWEEINKKRQLTGLKGEEIAVVLEQEYLESINRKDLANKVRHLSKDVGDGLGYDILSYFDNGREKYIEVKSTTSSLKSPFYISRNELGFLKEHANDYFVYRIVIPSNLLEEPTIATYTSQDVLDLNDIIPTQYMVKAKQ